MRNFSAFRQNTYAIAGQVAILRMQVDVRYWRVGENGDFAYFKFSIQHDGTCTDIRQRFGRQRSVVVGKSLKGYFPALSRVSIERVGGSSSRHCTRRVKIRIPPSIHSRRAGAEELYAVKADTTSTRLCHEFTVALYRPVLRFNRDGE
ncbi:hypothetical protein KCP69_17490 [Salmonella enterica subsp. enterica]|nr:hypothetical protein KCP69_17490 [Salmonella enterica subsp. enterica]